MSSSFARGSLFALLLGGTLGLAACGGGGGGSSAPPAPTPTPPSVSGTCPSPPPAGNGTAYAVGATRTWCVSVATIGTSNITYQPVATTLLAQSTHLNLWVDNADTGQLTTANWQQLATDFDSIYPLDTQYFGGTTFPQLGTTQAPFTFTECTTLSGPTVTNYKAQPNFSKDNNGYGPQIDMVATNKLGGGEGGYFSAIDLVANASALCAGAFSNEAQVFFAATPATSAGTDPTSFYLDGDALRAEAHEFQHMLHAINKTYTGFASTGQEAFDPSWIDEGFSMLAEDLAFPSSPGPSGDPIRWAFQFINAPSNYSLTEFEGFDCAPTATSSNCPKSIYNYTGGNYGAAYLFWRWVADQKGTGILKTVLDNQDTSPGGSGINEVLSATGYLSFPQMFDDWEMAIAASQKYGPSGVFAYALDPQEGNNVAFDDSYGTYTIPSPCSVPNPSPGVTCNLANHTATFAFPGPQPPSALTGGSLPSANGAQALSFYASTANYVPISGTVTSPDDSMSATDTTGGSGIVGGYVAQTATQSIFECPTAGSKVGCTVTGSPDPTSVVFVVGMGNAPANAGDNAPSLSSFNVNLAADQTSIIPAPAVGPASVLRLPRSTLGPAVRGDGFLRRDRPAAVGARPLRRLFLRGVVRGIQPLNIRRR